MQLLHRVSRKKINFYFKNKVGLGIVVHTCHPSYSGGRDREDHGSRTAWGKMLVRHPFQKKC
jgi:hypothetical protein